MNKEDRKATPLSAIRDKYNEASAEALATCLEEDTASVLGIENLAGYALVAWGEDGRPMVYPRLFRRRNPIPAYVLPAYLQMAVHWWIEDGMPEGFKRS